MSRVIYGPQIGSGRTQLEVLAANMAATAPRAPGPIRKFARFCADGFGRIMQRLRSVLRRLGFSSGAGPVFQRVLLGRDRLLDSGAKYRTISTVLRYDHALDGVEILCYAPAQYQTLHCPAQRVLCQVPCHTEGEDSLTGLDYDDKGIDVTFDLVNVARTLLKLSYLMTRFVYRPEQ
ncbi:hypothetical protein C8R48DRAFT_774297 [Suillus tomentosus]|nr:hypothetical protein C8R48DRAFT_774297 [Suillus tomentosus]